MVSTTETMYRLKHIFSTCPPRSLIFCPLWVNKNTITCCEFGVIFAQFYKINLILTFLPWMSTTPIRNLCLCFGACICHWLVGLLWESGERLFSFWESSDGMWRPSGETKERSGDSKGTEPEIGDNRFQGAAVLWAVSPTHSQSLHEG